MKFILIIYLTIVIYNLIKEIIEYLENKKLEKEIEKLEDYDYIKYDPLFYLVKEKKEDE